MGPLPQMNRGSPHRLGERAPRDQGVQDQGVQVDPPGPGCEFSTCFRWYLEMGESLVLT